MARAGRAGARFFLLPHAVGRTSALHARAWRCEKGPAGGSRRGQVEGGNAQAGDGRTPTIITDRSVTSPAYEGGAGANVKQLTFEG